MRYSEIIEELTEASLPPDFAHSDWGYWIEPDGKIRPVERHQHYTMYRIGWEAFASGRIRVTSISDPAKVKTESGMRVFAANFFVHFVTKKALRTLMLLLSKYEFEVFSIVGVTFKTEAAFNGSDATESWEEREALRIDPRSCTDVTTRNIAMASIRAFLSTARDTPPVMLDATPETPWQQKQKKKR